MDNCYQTQTSVMFVHAIMLGYLSVCDSLFAILWGDSLGRFSGAIAIPLIRMF
jgi:hypothetical protein